MVLRFGVADQEVPFFLGEGAEALVVDPVTIVVEIFKPGRKVDFTQSGNKTAFRWLGNGWYTYKTAPIDCDTYGINIFRASYQKFKALTCVDVVPDYPKDP